MNGIVEVTGSDLNILLRDLYARRDNPKFPVYKVSFSIDLGQVKVKVNEDVWSPPLGGPRA